MVLRIATRLKLDSTYKLGLDRRTGRVSKVLSKGHFHSPMDRARMNKGGMGDLRFYRTQPHESWTPV